MIKDGIDATSVEGAATLPYAIPNLHVDLHSPQVGVPVLWWRSVGSTHTAYSTETFIDELATTAGKDPVAFRKALLAKQPQAPVGARARRRQGRLGHSRSRRARAAQSARAASRSTNRSTPSVAQVAEVTVSADKSFTVDRVVCAVDCGWRSTPTSCARRWKAASAIGLSAALYGEITIKDGGVEQSNFHDYRVLRINEMPAIEVHIVPSTEAPTGVGEPGVPPIAPAVANALAAATGQRLRKLPLDLSA